MLNHIPSPEINIPRPEINIPGPEIYTNEELVNSIKNINTIKKGYKEKYEKFYEKFCGIGHGTASEEVIDIVFGEDINV